MKIAVIGGDARMREVSKRFCDMGYICLGQNAKNENEIYASVSESDVVILPMPCKKGEYLNAPFVNDKIRFDELIAACGKSRLIIGGMVGIESICIVDYALREELLIRNAVPTAEGAIAIAMNELKRTIHGSRALVLGYGRIGVCLAERLRFLGAEATVAARSLKSRALAVNSGLKAVGFEDIEASLSGCDVVFNTVPHKILDALALSALRTGTAVIDLASLPGGVDDEAASALGVKVIHALALPGKVAPITAGGIIADTVITILRERGIIK